MAFGFSYLCEGALVIAHLLATLSAAEWEDCFSFLGSVLIFTPGDLRSISLSELPLAAGRGVQNEILREL